MWNGFDADVVYWHTRRSFSREPTAYTVYMRCREGSLFRSPKYLRSVTTQSKLATSWHSFWRAHHGQRRQRGLILAGRPAAGQRNLSYTPGRSGPNPLIRPEPLLSPLTACAVPGPAAAAEQVPEPQEPKQASVHWKEPAPGPANDTELLVMALVLCESFTSADTIFKSPTSTSFDSQHVKT